MYPVKSIIDNALTDIRSKIEEQVYSTLAAHLKDYEGDAEDFTDRYGEFKEANINESFLKPINPSNYNTLKNIINNIIPEFFCIFSFFF